MKLKYLFSKKDVIHRIKAAINQYGPRNPYLKNSHFQALKSIMKEKSFASFYYFLFKKFITNNTVNELELEQILEKDLDKVFVDFILKKYKKTEVYKNGKILNIGYKTFLKRINKQLPEGERYYVYYSYLHNPLLKKKNGELKRIQKGGKYGAVLYQKDQLLNPNGKIIFPGEAVQYEFSF